MGAIRVQHDPIALEQSLSLRLDSVALEATLRIGAPHAIRRLGFGVRQLKSFAKLEVVQYLMQRGWTGSDDDFLLRGGGLHFRRDVAYSTLAYLKVLCLSQAIFRKPGDLRRIWHHGREYYYNMLLQLPNLSGVSGLANDAVKALDSGDCKAILAGVAAPLAPLEPLPDEEDDPAGAGEAAMLALPAPGPVALGAPAAAAPAAGPAPAPPHLPPIVAIVAGIEGQKVNFDNYTHQSGRLRCFTYCKFHEACRRYVFADEHPSKDRAAAWLLAWAVLGASFDEKEEHTHADPDDDLVEAVALEQFG